MNKLNLFGLVLVLALGAARAEAPANAMTAPFSAVMAATRAMKPTHAATGYVTGVSDGDTFYMQIDGKSTRVRLAQIDSPERAQPFGRRAEQSLRELLGKREVTATWREIDRYGRPVVQVEVGGVDVNAEQVKRGFAWVYRQYSNDARLIALEQEARSAGRGLWSDQHPVEPWAWRKAK